MAAVSRTRLRNACPQHETGNADRSERVCIKAIGRSIRAGLHRRGQGAMKLEGRFALITGASQGLGAEIARHYVTNGASVMLCARSADKLATEQQNLATLLAPGARIVTIAGDVGEPKDVDRIFDKLHAEFPRLDILVNNAGIYG